MKITFHGAARTVTGSKHLITTSNNKKILLDCGLFQDMGSENDTLNRHFGFAPAEVDALILSHAHIDHSGNIPQLVKQGFTGTVYCTAGTLDLCKIMLADSAHIQENDAAYMNKRRIRQGYDILKPLYTADDVSKAMLQFKAVPMNQWEEINDEVKFKFTDAGHILGSAAVSIEIKDEKVIKIYFSGDTGRYSDIILKSPAVFPQADYIITETTYGDREHEKPDDAEQHLLNIVKTTCVDQQGKLIIPAFSLGRTQEIVYALNELHNKGLIPLIPVFVDSPLAVNATVVMRNHPEYFNDHILSSMELDPDPFGFDQLVYIQDVESSKALNLFEGPCIIISASGMIEAGRIKHHIKNNISDAKNTILIVGYVPPGTIGDRLLHGALKVKIFGEEYDVRARIEKMDYYSAHADYNELLKNLSCQDPKSVKKVFMVHGEEAAQEAFGMRLNKAGFANVVSPVMGESFELK